MRPRADVPEWLWVSDSLIVRPGGNHGNKMTWTPALLARASAMRQGGDSWPDISSMVYEQTGIRLSANRTAEIVREWGEADCCG